MDDPDVQSAEVSLVSILTWNGIDETLKCLGGISLGTDSRFKVLVLDNGSSSDPSEQLSREFPGVEVIRLASNLGFTGGHNHVIRLAMKRGYHSVLMLNNDCSLDMQSMIHMRRVMDSNARAAAVSALVYRRGAERKALMVAGYINWAAKESVRPSNPDAVTPPGAPTLLVGTAVLLNCAVMKQIGLLDDRYFAYYDDNDLSARIFAAGYEVLYAKDAVCLHAYKTLTEHSATALYLMSRNQWLFWRTHTPPAFQRGMTRSLLSQSLHDTALLIKNDAPEEKINAIADGAWSAWKGQFGAPAESRSSPRWLRLLFRAAPYRMHIWLRNAAKHARGGAN